MLNEADDWPVDAVICAIGTTIGKAGSKEAFRYVDYELPLAFANRAVRQGAKATTARKASLNATCKARASTRSRIAGILVDAAVTQKAGLHRVASRDIVEYSD